MIAGPVQRAVRAAIAPGAVLRTPARAAPFVVEAPDGEELVLRLGAGQWRTPLSWECIEGIADFLRGKGWVKIGTKYDVKGEAGTLDGYLKGCVNRATASWVTQVLATAGVVELNGERPLGVRLRSGF